MKCHFISINLQLRAELQCKIYEADFGPIS